MKIDKIVVVARDVAIWGAGVYGIVHQERTGVVHVELLVLYMGILSIPGGLGIMALIRGGASPTPDSPSPPAPSVSSSPPHTSGSDEGR